MFTNCLRLGTRLKVPSRSFTLGCSRFNAQKSPLFQLRQRTGLAYNLCREALNKHNNDVDQAQVWLEAQALAHGLQKATKVGSRSTKEGLISLAVNEDNKSITMLELNCETDFVAKNQIFRDFTVDLTQRLASSDEGFRNLRDHDDSPLEELVVNHDKINNIGDEIAPLLTRLGENIRLQKAIRLTSKSNDVNIYGRIHALVGHRKVGNLEIQAGRFGAIVVLKFNSNMDVLSKDIGIRLCNHVIGYNPSYIELPEELRKHLEEAEKDRAEAKTEEMDADFEEVDSIQNNRDDWPSIMDQQLIMSEDQTVRDYCAENRISIVHFRRFECGNDS